MTETGCLGVLVCDNLVERVTQAVLGPLLPERLRA
jgi:hypothetical protein